MYLIVTRRGSYRPTKALDVQLCSPNLGISKLSDYYIHLLTSARFRLKHIENFNQ